MQSWFGFIDCWWLVWYKFDILVNDLRHQ